MAESVSAAEEIVANRAFFFIDDCANFAEATLIFYEYCITVDSEIRLIWQRKFSGASVLVFLNRYIMIFDNAITVGSYWPISNLIRRFYSTSYIYPTQSCDPTLVHSSPFSTLRVYALCGRDWRIAALVCLLMTGPIIANAYNIPTQTPVNLPQPYNCEVDNAVTIALHTKYVPRLPLLSSSRFTFSPRAHWQTYVSQFAQRARTATTLNYNWGAVVLGSRISLIVGDALVLAVTWWKTYRLKRAADAARVKTFIVELLLRDGTIYFGTMLVLNVLHIIINFVEQVSFMGDIADVLTSILVSRFLMNLRALDAQETGQASASGAPGTWHAVPGADSAGGGGSLVFEPLRGVDGWAAQAFDAHAVRAGDLVRARGPGGRVRVRGKGGGVSDGSRLKKGLLVGGPGWWISVLTHKSQERPLD
ncbi:hypothetical protein TRAPUB_11782 [Trametes pubescens]|uniref:DUF6533 domain-containing protein n=1 Tax=Trametes pubescens TaxID=154538 RepID=A0A1M2VW37_TRAPU|nr:hypothetical protein TRAPUB_11782 [Trametes pubescens]